MKRISAIILLSAYLFSAAEVKELLKIDVLIAHFHETRQLDSSVSFFGFLVMHYITDDANNNDNDRDMQLPFKAPEDYTAHNSMITVAGQFSYLDLKLPAVNETLIIKQDDPFPVIDFHTLVWRPPQFS